MDTPNDVIGRVAAVLRALSAQEPNGATTAALVREVDLARATIHRILTSLTAQGLVDRDDAGRWLLGPELYLFGAMASGRYDLRNVARPWVRRLAEATGESAFFSTVRGDETVCLLREDGAFPIRSHVLYEGVRFPLGVVSAGIAVLAFLPEGEIEEYLRSRDLTAAYGESHSAGAIRARLEQTRNVGWSLNPGLIVPGSWGMAAAVFAGNRPVGALTLTGIEARFGPERVPELGALLLKAAHGLGRAAQGEQAPSRT